MEETPALGIIKKIQSGQTDPKLLDKEERQQCVEVLYLEGYGVAELAEILGKSDKTIRRDLEEIRKANALSPGAELAKEFVGEMVQNARIKQGRLERLAKSKDGSVSERAQAEYLSWRIVKEMIEKLSDLGYLPSRPMEIVGDIFHHGRNNETPVKSFDEISGIIHQIKEVAKKTGTFDPQIVKEIEELDSDLDRAKLTHKAIDILGKQEKLGKEKQDEQ